METDSTGAGDLEWQPRRGQGFRSVGHQRCVPGSPDDVEGTHRGIGGLTSPEELLAAAHAACFSMAFSNELSKAGFVPDRVDVTASVLGRRLDAWTVISSTLDATAKVPNISEAQFQQIAETRQGRLPDLAGDQGQRRAGGERHTGAMTDADDNAAWTARFRGRIPGTAAAASRPTAGRRQPVGLDRRCRSAAVAVVRGLPAPVRRVLLLLEQLVPGTQALGPGSSLRSGVALLVSWAVNRRVWQLYAGAILTAISLPALLQDLNVIHEGQGWGTLFLGIAFLLIALIRVGTRGGIGWQLVVGTVLAVVGGVPGRRARDRRTSRRLERLIWPALILVVGVAIVYRSARARR